MKYKILLFFFLCILSSLSTQAQVVPHDSIVLKTIYGDGEPIIVVDENYDSFFDIDTFYFSIVLSEWVTLDGKEVLFVVSSADADYVGGHFYGITEHYYLEQEDDVWHITKEMQGFGTMPIGDDQDLQLVTIGNKGQKALLTHFESTGNHHYEKNVRIDLITPAGLQEMGHIELSYSNEAWRLPEDNDPEGECMIDSYAATYKIEPNERKKWFDIEVTTTHTDYSKGCKTHVERKETATFTYDGKGYKLKK